MDTDGCDFRLTGNRHRPGVTSTSVEVFSYDDPRLLVRQTGVGWRYVVPL